MIYFKNSLAALESANFESVLKADIESLSVNDIPLQQALTNSSYAVDRSQKAVVLSVTNDEKAIIVKAGIFYSGMVAGCNCADDPTPVDLIPEHCIIQITIDTKTAVVEIQLVDE